MRTRAGTVHRGRAASGRPPKAVVSHTRRMRAMLVVFALLLTAVVGRLVQLQALSPERLEELGDAQVVRSVTLPADRGTLLDRAGHDLALSLAQPTLWADPFYVVDPAATAAALAPILGLDATELTARLAADSRFVYLARQVPEEVAAAVGDLRLPGINRLDEPARFNPSGDLARSLLGSVNIDGVGRAGLELQYDSVLAGAPGELIVERAPDGRTIPQGGRRIEPSHAGEDLVLTIDRGMQYEAERALGARIEATSALAGTVIVMNPRNGEIYAMANMALPVEGGPAVPTSDNRALTAVFEPGSVNKVITLAAALEEGVVTPTDHLQVPDRLLVADHTFSDHDAHPVASWTPTDVLATSSNIGTILLAQSLGRERVDEYLRRFGFGSPTGLGFPNESGGLLLDAEDWSGTAIGSIPIGQGVAVTPMQMLAAFNVIANDGVYVEPNVVLATVDADGERHDAGRAAERRVVSETTARSVRDMMVAVVEAGTGREAAIDGYSVAGKTGTARKPQANGTYQDAAGNYHYVTTFAGFVPAQDPQLSIIVVIDEPSNGYYASHVAAPVFADLARYALRQFRIPPPGEAYHSTVPDPTAAEMPILDPVDAAVAESAPVRGQAATTTTTTVPATTTSVAPDPPDTG